jgi:hypothetical protein
MGNALSLMSAGRSMLVKKANGFLPDSLDDTAMLMSPSVVAAEAAMAAFPTALTMAPHQTALRGK